MKPEEFQSLRRWEGGRVRITFTDGQKVIARLLSVVSDLDGSQHLIYDEAEWSALPHQGGDVYYSAGEELTSCQPYSELNQRM